MKRKAALILCWIVLRDGSHVYNSWLVDLYNSLLVFFKQPVITIVSLLFSRDTADAGPHSGPGVRRLEK